MQYAIKLENISNLITSPSSYQCRKTMLVHFVIHGRHTSMECMCTYWGSPKINFQNKWKKKILSYRIIRIKHIFSGVYWCITWTKSFTNLHKSLRTLICLWVNWSRSYINKLRKKCVLSYNNLTSPILFFSHDKHSRL
jgi:hypothetical protein